MARTPLGAGLAVGSRCACSTAKQKEAWLFLGGRQGFMLHGVLVDDLGVGLVDGTLFDDDGELTLKIRYLTTPFQSATWALQRRGEGWAGKRQLGESGRAGGRVVIPR